MLNPSRFSDILSDASLVIPGSSYEYDPTVDYQIHTAAFYTMATCHSLRKVDGKIVGDPLDVKMFEFTGWSFEEDFLLRTPGMDAENSDISTSVVRPPTGMEFGAHNARDSIIVRYLPGARPPTPILKLFQGSPIELILLKSFEFVSLLRRASVIVQQYGKSNGDIYVKGAPECIKEICHPDSSRSRLIFQLECIF